MATQKQFVSRLAILAEFCGFNLSKEMVALYERALSRFGYEKATAAVEAAILERRGQDRMPSIGDLVNRCAPAILDGDSAVEVSTRILSAIRKFGHPNGADARDWVGEVGWHVVGLHGGWAAICQKVNEKDLPVWAAQLRDQAAATLRRHKAGVLAAPPSFNELPNNRMTALVGAVLTKK